MNHWRHDFIILANAITFHPSINTPKSHSYPLNPPILARGNVHGTFKTHTKLKMTHLHVQSSETHEDLFYQK